MNKKEIEEAIKTLRARLVEWESRVVSDELFAELNKISKHNIQEIKQQIKKLESKLI